MISRRGLTMSSRGARSCGPTLLFSLSATLLAASLLLVPSSFASTGSGDAWSKFRGPDAEGLALDGLLPDGEFGLTIEWSQEIGSAYSGVSGAEGRLYTLLARGDLDLVVAFDAETGKELWAYEIGPRYVGHDGSDDGPLSTPAVVDGTVYSVGAQGQVVALDAETGVRRWLFELTEQNSSVPFYGYTTSPVLNRDSLFLATGGEGRSVTALDRHTGAVRWTSGSDAVEYQTPTLMRLGGREAVLLAGAQWLLAFDASTGEELWQLRHAEGNEAEQSSHVTPVADGRFLVNYDRGARLYRADAESVEEVWRTRAFANSLTLPVVVGDSIFGFTRSILTSVDVGTGEIQWRSREPGGQGLTRVDDKLAIINSEGALVLADADSAGYRELTRIAAFDTTSTHSPSFIDGSFLVRNLETMVSIRADVTAAPRTVTDQITERTRGSFGDWISEIEGISSGRRQAAVDRRLGEGFTSPIFEGTDGDRSLAHFVWRGQAGDVGLGGPVVGGQEVGFERVEGTDLFFKTLELVPAAQYDYTLSFDYGEPTPDPNNAFTVDQGFAALSEVRMPDWPAAPHLAEPGPDAPRGTVDSFPFRSLALGNTRQIQVWRPPNYGANSETTYPLMVVHHGDNQVRGSLMTNTLDNLVGRSVAPVVAVFVPRAAGPEYGGPETDRYNRFVVDELIPHLRKHYQLTTNGFATIGPGSAAVAALHLAMTNADLFSKVAAQSYYPLPATERSFALLEGDGQKPEQAFVIYSNRDYEDTPLGGGAKEASQELVERLRAAGVETQEMVTEYSPSWSGWRGQHDDILRAFFPLEE